jgi:hypothetical protein
LDTHRISGIRQVVLSALLFMAMMVVVTYLTRSWSLSLAAPVTALFVVVLLPVAGLVRPSLLREAMKLPLRR